MPGRVALNRPRRARSQELTFQDFLEVSSFVELSLDVWSLLEEQLGGLEQSLEAGSEAERLRRMPAVDSFGGHQRLSSSI